MNPIDPTITAIAACVQTMLLCFIMLAAFQSTVDPAESLLPPRDVLEEMIDQIADSYNVKIKGLKRPVDRSDDGIVVVKKKRKMVKYDRPRALACVMSDWMSPLPRFDDKQFHLKCV